MAEESGLEFRILGDLEVWRDGRRLDVGSPRQRELLALLLLHRNRVVATDRLIDLMWGSRPPRTAANTLHVLVSGIRRALNGEGAESVLMTRRPGYELRTEHGAVDLERFEALRDSGFAAAARGDNEAASDGLRRALDLWRGDPLPELCDVMDLAGELGRLRELRLAAVEARVDADLALGRHHDVVGELEALVDAEPLRERLRGQLMLALYRSGQQARALEVYRDGRRHLVDELGVEPGPELRELQVAILRQDESVGNGRPAERSRPSRRRRRFVAAGVALAGVSMLIAVMIWHSGAPASRAAGSAGGVTLVDGEGVRTSSAIPGANAVSAEPGGAVWVASASGGTITRISADGSRSVAGVGGRPTDLAWGFGRVWVGDAPGRRIEAYDPKRRAVVVTIPLRNALGPVAQAAANLAVGAGSVWVDTGGLAGVWRIDPATGKVLARIRRVQTGAIAFGMGSVWVAGDFFGSDRVDRIDPARNAVVGSIPLPSGDPVSMAATDGWLWVACDNGTLWRVGVSTRRVTRVATSGEPVSVSASGGAVWVAEADPNRVVELDPATGHATATRLSGLPTAVAAAGGSAWVATVPQHPPVAAGRAGRGVVTVALNTGIDSIDPAVAQWATAWQLEYATGLRLLNYPDRPGSAGDQVVPDAAAAMPRVSDGGRTHAFTVRRGLRFWPGGKPVTAAAFRAAVERDLSPGVNAQFGYDFMSDLVGGRAYRKGRAAHVSGIQLLGRYRISFTTVKPNPAFDDYIAAPMYAAVPPDTPDVRVNQPLPSAGPYYIATYVPQRLIVLRRNPGYQGGRPAVPSEIRYVLGGAAAEPSWKQVADGHADVDADPATPQQLAMLRAGASAGKVHVRVDPAPVILYLLFNTRSPAVRDPRVRRAVSDAIDRAALAATFGPEGATPTDQYLVPSLVGYPGDEHVYPLDRARPRAARRLLRAAGVRLPLTLRLSTCDTPDCVNNGTLARVALLRSELGRIGIHLVVLGGPRSRQFNRDLAGNFDIADEGFGGFPTSDPGGLDFPLVTEARYGPTAAMKRADATPFPRRARVWRTLELALARREAPLAAFAIPNTITITSRRVGCLVYQLQFGLDLGKLCPVS